METLPCASEMAQLQPHQHQQQSESLVSIKRVSLPFGDNHSLMNAVITKADDVSHILKSQKSQHTDTLAENGAQLVTANNSMDTLCENVVTIPKELILISLVSQEQALYNPKHQLYRSTKSKDEKWSQIGSQVGWSDAQCKAKWKAMRDQYCRELKRAKTNKGNVKWKYFKELDFLRPFALARNYRSRSSQNSNSSNQNLNLNNDTNRFANIKIEDTSASLLENCSFAPNTTTTGTTTSTPTVDKKSDSARSLMGAFISDHIMQQHQQQDTNWNYLTDTSGNGVSSATSITVTCETANTTAGDTLYNEFVDCVNAANAVSQSSTTHNNQQTNADEEDDDPIHTFLNMESYFEKELITLIQQEDMIYNYSNQNYRNVKLKLEAWDEISRKLKKPVKQCRQKWKALRDQYAREYKRLKTQMHVDAISRWKHYDSLGFLQKYIQQKTLDGDALSILLPKHDSVAESEEHLDQSPLRHAEPQPSTLEASSSSSQLNISTLPPLTGPHKAELSISMPQPQQQQQQQQQEVQQPNELCVASYDEMDIVENYINGNVTHDDDDDEEDEDEDMEATPTSDQPEQQQQHVVSYGNEEDPVYMAVRNALSKPEQLAKTGSNLETQQLQQQQQLQTGSEYSQKLDIHTPTSNSARFQTAATTPSTPSQAAFPMGGVSSAPAEEDEIGAFFKAVAMKIRNAHLDPVAFTDLQIDILRVINEALRNH